MSKKIARYYLISAAFVLFLQFFTYGQDIDLTISVDAEKHSARVEGEFLPGFTEIGNSLVFRKSVIGNERLAARISKITVAQGDMSIAGEMIMPVFAAKSKFSNWSYNVDLSPAKNRAAAAHASWLGDGVGVLMLDDLLPQFSANGNVVSADVKLNLPSGWSFQTTEKIRDGRIMVPSLERSVIFVGKDLRNISSQKQRAAIDLTLSGTWIFTDAEAEQMVDEIYGEYTRMLGPLPIRPKVAILRFPTNESPGAWEAETRGETVTIVSSDMHFKTQSQQRLHEQLRHEIFHLWFPNGVDLKGNYAWFYEGFALYESLKLGVKLDRIGFDDMLDTLSRAYTIDANQKPRKPLTGPDASTEIYARGMIVAFLLDLDLLKESNGKYGSTEALAELFRLNKRPGRAARANDEITTRLGIRQPISDYVLGAKPIEWQAALSTAGITASTNGRTTTLSLLPKLNGDQKAILRHLGYNNQRKR